MANALYKGVMNNIINQMADKLIGKEDIARSPRDGLWYGVDRRILRGPITDGYKTQSEAKKAYRLTVARWSGDTTTRNNYV